MRFGEPQFFWLLLMIPVLTGFFIWAYQRKRSALHRFVSPLLLKKLTPDVAQGSQVLRWILFTVAYFFFVIALCRPQFGVKTEMVERKGIDIMVALDISNSMYAQDVSPSRIERAKYEIAKFTDLIKGDNIGLIVFAGESFVQCPLTLDYGAFKMFLESVRSDWIQIQGTALADAIKQAMKSFTTNGKKDRVLIIISDGEDHEGDVEGAVKRAAQEGIIIYTVGVGSESGVPIPVQSQGGNVVYKKDQNNNLVMTKLNSEILERIAAETKGKYFYAGVDLDLVQIYKDIDAMQKRDLGMNRLAVYEERYQIFLAIGILFLLLEFLLPMRVRRKEEWRGRLE